MTQTNGTDGANGTNGYHSSPVNGTNSKVSCENGARRPERDDNSNGTNNEAKENDGNVANNTGAFEPIAICGMACRLPGGIKSPDELWKFLMEQQDARVRVPATRFNIDGYYSATKKPGSTNSQYGYFLDESVDLAGLDTTFFSMHRVEAEWLDPQQKLMLEVARESLDDAGEVDYKGSNVGVYIGSFGQDWYDILNREPLRHNPVSAIASHDFMISERVSHAMDLRGPSMTIRTACSSALISLNEACMAIAKGDCGSAIVGGANLVLAPDLVVRLSDQGILSPDGSCNTFSSGANGYARGEAIVSIFIKSLSAAIRDGNPIRSVITGTAANFDGRTNPLTNPSATAQEALIRRAYEVAGISDLSKTAMFECHGTGTATGDPIETEAIAAVFGEQGIYLGAVKPNLGHSEGASGLTAVLKATLALENKTIPPNIKYSPLNPKIPWKSAKLRIPEEPTPWPVGRDERVSINSFGVGGSNGHAILESAATVLTSRHLNGEPQLATQKADGPQLLLFSAKTPYSLKGMISNYERLLNETPMNLVDLAYTLATRREHFSNRSFAIATKDKFDISSTVAKESGSLLPSSLVMVFTGQGAAWPQMGRDLMISNSTFSSTIRSLQRHLQTLGSIALTWSLEEELLKPARTSRVYEAEFSQPLCTALQIGLVDTLAAVGVRPTAVVGHSSGEIAAAYAAGALTANEAITVAYFRGVAPVQQEILGGMAAVGMGWVDVDKYLVPGVVVACDNSHSSVTLSGDRDVLEAVVANIKEMQPDIALTMLKVEKAYHSHHMLPVGEAYHNVLVASGVVGKAPSIPFFSSVTGYQYGQNKGNNLGPKYWQTNMENPVLFKSAVIAILRTKDINNEVFLELGPHSALAGPLRQILTAESSKASYVASLLRRQNSAENILQTIGKLYMLDLAIDLHSLAPSGSCVASLPCYPWDHEKRYFFESRLAREWRGREHPDHNLLGTRLAESTTLEPMWRNLLQVAVTPWLVDHRIGETIVFPFAGYVSIAAEACRQVSGVNDGVSLRNVEVSTALVVAEEGSTEIVTTMRHVRLNDELDSEWWEFSVCSHNGHIWTKHCWGEVRGESVQPDTGLSKALDLPREVDTSNWYETVRRQGLVYGPTFTSMENVKTSTQWPFQATAKTRNNRWDDCSEYHLHPIILDTILQLVSTSASHGISRSYQRLVASKIESMSIFRCTDDQLSMFVTSEPTTKGFVGSGTIWAGSKTVFQMTNSHAHIFEEPDVLDNTHVSMTARCEWTPHIDFMALKDLIRAPVSEVDSMNRLNELSRMAIAVARNVAKNIEARTPHLAQFTQWLDQMVSPSIIEADTASLKKDMESLLLRFEGSTSATTAKSVSVISNNIENLLTGLTTGFDILNAEGTLDHLVRPANDVDYSGFLQCLGNSKPNLRVLEFSSDLGEATAMNVKSLTRADGSPLYSKYVVITTSLIAPDAMKERLKSAPNVEVLTLDLAQPWADQGLEGQFDLVIARGIVSTSNKLLVIIKSLREVLSHSGRLLLEESKPGKIWLDFVLGTMPDWWSHGDDGRVRGPFLTAAEWREGLTAAGFAKVEEIHSGEWASHVLIARPELQESHKKRITLLCDSGPPAQLVTAELKSRGYQIDHCVMGQDLPRGQDVVALLEETSPLIAKFDANSFAQFRSFVQSLEGSGVLWVTRLSTIGGKNPMHAQAIGLIRTIRSEMAIDIATCEMASITSSQGASDLVDVIGKFQTRADDGILGPEYEYAIHNGEILVNRIFPFSLEEELAILDKSEGARLTISQPGRLSTLAWSSQSLIDPKDDEVELEIHACGLNFRDVLVGMQIIPSKKEPTFGYEAAGVVRRVGKNVTKLRAGDRAVVLGSSTFSTVLTAPAILCEKLSDNISFLEGACIPTVFMTAVYGLMDLGHLSKDQSVLIHSGCGGVGLAAIQVAQMLGAEIYTTVGSESKVQYLMETCGIPRNRIFNSRSDSFVENLLRETGGKGADVVLNSLSGELLHASWKCVAEWGTMVEIGKRDLLGNGRLDMHQFLANRSYCCLDLDQMTTDRPEVENRLLRYTLECFAEGLLKPIRIDQVFPASATPEAFRYMQQGKHIGKIVLEIRDAAEKSLLGEINFTKRAQAELDEAGSYLLIGGLGGLGRAMSVWMVERGARSLTFLARSAGHGLHDESFRRELESMGCSVQLVRGDVTNADDVARAMDGVLAPLKGIVQMSMVLRDRMFKDMSIEEWKDVTGPKVQGTWNLHTAALSRGLDLDFFLLFSSLSGILGQVGQANYASANTFLDAFAQYRNSIGLPCSAIDLGAMEGIGFLSENRELLRKMQGSGWRSVREVELLEALELAMISPISRRKNGDAVLLGLSPTIPLSSQDSSARLRRDVRMAIYHNTGSGGSSKGNSTNDSLKTALATFKKDPGLLCSPEPATILAVEIGKKLAALLLSGDGEVDITASTADLGLDSMVAVELRGWWKLTFGFEISTLEMLSMGTLEALGKRAAEGLRALYGA
ncbi:hypothetical protein VTL71DRAFT_8492 [Oculimacula yallundae]|uniref:Polyketide synthase n=1 Tax=Oculimacula yallundae TaxID=86028 RepID=A0ABR4CY01_9HELO